MHDQYCRLPFSVWNKEWRFFVSRIPTVFILNWWNKGIVSRYSTHINISFLKTSYYRKRLKTFSLTMIYLGIGSDWLEWKMFVNRYYGLTSRANHSKGWARSKWMKHAPFFCLFFFSSSIQAKPYADFFLNLIQMWLSTNKIGWCYQSLLFEAKKEI